MVNIGLIHIFEVVNIRRGPKNGLMPKCEARQCFRQYFQKTFLWNFNICHCFGEGITQLGVFMTLKSI